MALALLTIVAKEKLLAELESQDIQGLVISAFAHLPCSTYLLLRITDAGAARRWLLDLSQAITTADGKQEVTSLNVALTHHGLAQLGLDAEALATFSRPFLEGMATPHRSRILGDAEENAPANWKWGGDDQSSAVDILLLLFARDETALEDLLKQHRDTLGPGGIVELVALASGRQPDNHEHFGFADGMGQPAIEGSPQAKHAAVRNVLPAGEILLGHTNVYNKPADSPVVRPTPDAQRLLPEAARPEGVSASDQAMRDLGRNGTYLVVRQLAQNVAGFWQFLDEATRRPDGALDQSASTRLAAKFVGRWPSGAPLVLTPDKDDPALADADDFGYYDRDPKGFACPFGSHIRRANPRDSLGPNPTTALVSANRHRILRRGRSYGQRLTDLRVDDGAERGLHFVCLNSDIERQFEFVQQTWINNPVFGGLDGEVDPLVGYVEKGDAIMTVPADPLRTRVHNIRRFVTVKGGAYFFLPSISALRYLSSL